ncbi:MAG: Peptide chain release factor 1 [Alphaproteobacteria bacterium MarineAlpha9_Bin4]|nr:peptide chain release factor 1 [Pelagibacterales bacterium]PPR26629.1 MAG: Peptide chain release factor 1 [Alphaproteobacteria bacterium MarineAlpha9_Bin4]|tara:strand:+ start:2058 stop:3134 length:1077 start_codon:yes stop_codon:yes gene_type:complete
MHKDLQIKLLKIIEKYDSIQQELSSPEISTEKRIELSKKFSSLEQIVEKKKELDDIEKNLAETEELLREDIDTELVELAKDDIINLKKKLEEEYNKLKKLLIPKDKDDERNAIVEIRAGTGGDEAALFSMVLLRMYQKYGENNKWKFEILSFQETNIGGCKEAILSFSGKNVFSSLKYESGVHRVQRVPQTETQGRIHTSASTVAVLPMVEEVEVEIDQKDLRVDTFRSQGAGGQHVNTTDSAVRITHIPTNTVASCQDEKSQHKNKAKAMKILLSRIYEKQKKEKEEELASKRKSLVGSGDRSEKIRSYNYPQGRITDHRINLTLYKLEEVISGNALNEIISPLKEADIEEKIKDLS